jgi:hypothetical protein
MIREGKRCGSVKDNDDILELVDEEITRHGVKVQSEELSPLGEEPANYTNPKPTCPTFPMATSAVSVLAVIDANGYVIPIFTARDLLREFKAVWRAAQF